MTASRVEIENWVRQAKDGGATHLLVVTDTFDYDNYPVAVMPDEDVHERIGHFRAASMQRVEEVYDLSLGIDMQMAERRAWHT